MLSAILVSGLIIRLNNFITVRNINLKKIHVSDWALYLFHCWAFLGLGLYLYFCLFLFHCWALLVLMLNTFWNLILVHHTHPLVNSFSIMGFMVYGLTLNPKTTGCILVRLRASTLKHLTRDCVFYSITQFFLIDKWT